MKAELFWTDGDIPASMVAEEIASEIERMFGKVYSETTDKFFQAEDCKLHHSIYVFCEDRLATAVSVTLHLQRSAIEKCGVYGDRYINDRPVDMILLSFEKQLLEGYKIYDRQKCNP